MAAEQPEAGARRREAVGWERHIGWDQQTYLLASIYSAVMASGGAKDPAYPALPGRPVRQGKPLIPTE